MILYLKSGLVFYIIVFLKSSKADQLIKIEYVFWSPNNVPNILEAWPLFLYRKILTKYVSIEQCALSWEYFVNPKKYIRKKLINVLSPKPKCTPYKL